MHSLFIPIHLYVREVHVPFFSCIPRKLKINFYMHEISGENNVRKRQFVILASFPVPFHGGKEKSLVSTVCACARFCNEYIFFSDVLNVTRFV